MSLVDLCNRNPVTIAADASLVEAAQLMRARHVGFLVVTPDGREGPPIGVLTDRDIVVEVVSEGVDPTSVAVVDAMTRDPLIVRLDTSADQVLSQMRAFGVRRAPVIDATGCLIGVVALDDILDGLAGAIGNAAAVIRHVQSVERQQRA